jgi:superfamily I DNA/RNA helicase
MIPSKYQEKIYEFVKDGIGNGVIDAIAGSGKSTTIVYALNFIPDTKRVLFLAFNKSTVNELQEKINRTNTHIRTSHSLGFAMLKTHFKYQQNTPSLEVDEYKYRKYLKNNFNELTEGIEFKNKIEVEEFKDIILSLIDICRVYLCETCEEIETIADKYGYSVTGDHVRIIDHLIQYGWSDLETVDFVDMIALPNYFNIVLNQYKYDWVIIDECQDQNIAMQELFKRCMKKNGRFLGVGDPKQSIMVFAGSDEKSFKKLMEIPNTVKLDLSVNYRCPQIVLPLAKRFVPQFELRDNAIPGKFNHDVLVKDIKPNSMVICRNTAPLVELYLKLIQQNRKCYIKGIDIGANLLEIIERVNNPHISCHMKKDGVVPQLYKNLLEAREKLMVKKGLDVYDATAERSIIQQLEIINTIKALSYNINNTFELMDRIKKIFLSKNDENGICLITAHKAKGLEHEHVYLLCPSLVPSKLASKDWEHECESNLLYVIYTRTKNEFSTVSEVDFPPPQGSKDINEIVTHLSVMEGCIKNLFGKQTTTINEETPADTKVFKLPKKERQTEQQRNNTKNPIEKELEKEVLNDKKLKSFEKLMLGKTVEECFDIFNDLGITNDIRVVESNEHVYMITADFKPDRINVCLLDKKINNIRGFY